MTTETNDGKMEAKTVAGVLMAHMAGNLGEKFDTFATWLLAGFGAATALLLTSHEISSLVPVATVRFGGKMFLAAVVVTVIEKYLFIVVSAGSEAAEFSQEAIESHFKARREQNLPLDFDFHTFLYEFTRPIFKPALWIGSFSIRKIVAGDVNAGIRPLVVISQIQGLLLGLEVCLFVAAIWRIVATLPVGR